MFKKKPQIKSFAPLRTSDRRKLADQIIERFSVPRPQPQAEDGTESLSILRKSLLPDNTTAARFSTTAGPDLRQHSGTFYAGSFSSNGLRILWISFENQLLPSVYTLWQHPGLLPLLHTPDAVVQKLCSGSSLMTPGLTRGPPFPSKATKGSVVAIAALEKPSVPMVVGICEIDVACLEKAQGVKGQAVSSEHWAGDELWAWSLSNQPGQSPPDEIRGWDLTDGPSEVELPQALEKVSLDVNSKEISVPVLTTQELDDAFWHAFRFGIYEAIRKCPNEAQHGLEFPIAQSLTISHLVLPYLPIHAPEQANNFSIKKTSWKNTKKFIKALEKAHLVKSKDRDGGECVIVEVYFKAQSFRTFKPYDLPKKGSTVTSTSVEEAVSPQIQRLALFKPRSCISGIISDSKDYYTAHEFRSAVNSYLEREALLSAENRRIVKLNPTIVGACFADESPLDQQIVARGSLPRDALLERMLTSCCFPYGLILFGPHNRENSKPKAGSPGKVKMTLETRSGNKTVTKVSGIEEFGIQPSQLAEELQKACASSISVAPLVGCNPRQPVMEVMIQGPQKEFVWKALERKGVRREWVDFIDKQKSKK